MQEGKNAEEKSTIEMVAEDRSVASEQHKSTSQALRPDVKLLVQFLGTTPWR